ncbi:unnamed protein product [Protopolystoma xenopodis]|uniref:Uncharacterized protein n=1 Tax=Protopolystoma xenopodis TaxID=117903 RepID=A0A3S5ASY3_9PLAT|nr:unnamed protein product [Protopolystoma xenopodis]
MFCPLSKKPSLRGVSLNSGNRHTTARLPKYAEAVLWVSSCWARQTNGKCSVSLATQHSFAHLPNSNCLYTNRFLQMPFSRIINSRQPTPLNFFMLPVRLLWPRFPHHFSLNLPQLARLIPFEVVLGKRTGWQLDKLDKLDKLDALSYLPCLTPCPGKLTPSPGLCVHRPFAYVATSFCACLNLLQTHTHMHTDFSHQDYDALGTG